MRLFNRNFEALGGLRAVETAMDFVALVTPEGAIASGLSASEAFGP